MKNHFILIFSILLSFATLSCTKSEDTKSSNLVNASNIAEIVDSSRYFISFVLNNSTSDKKVFSKDKLISLIKKSQSDVQEKVFIKGESLSWSLVPENEQTAMPVNDFKKLPKDSIFRELRSNEKFPYLLTPQRRYATEIPMRYASKIKESIDTKVSDKTSKYEFYIEFKPRVFMIHFKEENNKDFSSFEIKI